MEQTTYMSTQNENKEDVELFEDEKTMLRNKE